MENIFDGENMPFYVKYYNNLDLKNGKRFDEEKEYKYEISIRHPEGTDAEELFDSQVKITPCPENNN